MCLKKQILFAAVAASLASGLNAVAADGPVVHGVAVTFSAGGLSDTATAPNVWLYVPNGATPSPFVAPGAFTAVFEGDIVVDLRGYYAFQADLNGALKLEVNGEPALEVTGTGGASETGKMLRLNKGENTLKATFTPAGSGDAFLRLNWQPKDSFLQPIPLNQLAFKASDALTTGNRLRSGRGLVAENHCTACHAAPGSKMPELTAKAPSLEGIGSRRQFDWLAKWIADPRSLRPNSHMPKLLHGDTAAKDASAVAAYLVSLSPTQASVPKDPAVATVEAGAKLFLDLHCAACHVVKEPGPDDLLKIPLVHVAQKFSDESLVAFLKKPSEHYPSIKMPQFRLKDEERSQLAAYVLSVSGKSAGNAAPTEADVIAHGKSLVQSVGCLNCHELKEDNKFSAKALAELTDFTKGCMAGAPSDKAPFFSFTADQRAALQAFAATDRSSLTRHVPAEFAARQAKNLNCTQCHGVYEEFPALTWFGEKLKPDFMAKFIAGQIDWKPRDWIPAQMPGFGEERATLLTEGMAHQHGVSAAPEADSPVKEDLAAIGHTLVGPIGGFSCTACHSVGSYHAQAFEAPGINFIHVGERIRASYFRRWLRNPVMVDPNTKMPAYFDEEGRSPYADVLDGDAYKQIDAIWNYIKLGEKMPLPKLE
jgi:mono/diheme cytochrome c family protein